MQLKIAAAEVLQVTLIGRHDMLC